MAVSHKSVPGAGFSSAQEDDDGGKGDGGEGAQSWGSSVQESDPRSLVLSVWCLMTPEVLLSTPLHYNGDILLLLFFSWNVWFYCGKYTQHKIYHSNHSYHISSELLHLPQLKLYPFNAYSHFLLLPAPRNHYSTSSLCEFGYS